jgi:hypothetical protein
MSVGPGAIIDAGPALTFLARKDTTRILLGAAPLEGHFGDADSGP